MATPGVDARLELHFGETTEETTEPTRPTIVDHFATAHPGEPVDVRVWWDIPYHHTGALVDGILQIDSAGGRMGETTGDNEYWCRLCDQILDPGELEVDYT